MYGSGRDGGGVRWGAWVLTSAFMVLAWGAVVTVAVLVVRSVRDRHLPYASSPPYPRDPPRRARARRAAASCQPAGR